MAYQDTQCGRASEYEVISHGFADTHGNLRAFTPTAVVHALCRVNCGTRKGTDVNRQQYNPSFHPFN